MFTPPNGWSVGAVLAAVNVALISCSKRRETMETSSTMMYSTFPSSLVIFSLLFTSRSVAFSLGIFWIKLWMVDPPISEAAFPLGAHKRRICFRPVLRKNSRMPIMTRLFPVPPSPPTYMRSCLIFSPHSAASLARMTCSVTILNAISCLVFKVHSRTISFTTFSCSEWEAATDRIGLRIALWSG